MRVPRESQRKVGREGGVCYTKKGEGGKKTACPGCREFVKVPRRRGQKTERNLEKRYRESGRDGEITSLCVFSSFQPAACGRRGIPRRSFFCFYLGLHFLYVSCQRVPCPICSVFRVSFGSGSVVFLLDARTKESILSTQKGRNLLQPGGCDSPRMPSVCMSCAHALALFRPPRRFMRGNSGPQTSDGKKFRVICLICLEASLRVKISRERSRGKVRSFCSTSCVPGRTGPSECIWCVRTLRPSRRLLPRVETDLLSAVLPENDRFLHCLESVVYSASFVACPSLSLIQSSEFLVHVFLSDFLCLFAIRIDTQLPYLCQEFQSAPASFLLPQFFLLSIFSGNDDSMDGRRFFCSFSNDPSTPPNRFSLPRAQFF